MNIHTNYNDVDTDSTVSHVQSDTEDDSISEHLEMINMRRETQRKVILPMQSKSVTARLGSLMK